MRKILTIILFSLIALCGWAYERAISLSGQWQFAFSQNMPQAYSDSIILPGTTDTNCKGTPLNYFSETTRLSRRYSYKGRAWYSREIVIPQEWANQAVTLTLERTKYTEAYLDGSLIGMSNNISTPQRYSLGCINPGSHVLTIMVSNAEGVPEQIYASSHAYTEDTQTNWNGIIGEITLSIEPTEAARATNAAGVIEVRDRYLYSNGHRLFLRGRHDACVWPLTGHVPMDVESWRRYMRVCQAYGLNHVRFHSWCPPEAAFLAADEAGIILQPELPFWGDFNAQDSTLMAFLHKEGENILREYGHHPSFRMFALGNELWGSIEAMGYFIEDFRQIAPDKLYTFGSNYYLGYQGVKPGMDYFTTCRVGGEAWGSYNTHTRGSFSFADAADGGMINHFRPNATMNFEEGCLLSPVPVISHETAQFQTYPDYSEIAKYTGVLRPCNLETFRQRLDSAGMGSLAISFHRASGRWSYLLYKQDIEMDLRTPSMSGFQLLDLQDYPGQGSAYVGMLDAFLDSKGICTPEEWRQFCSPVVPLLVADSYCYTNGDTLKARLQVANYSASSLAGHTLTARLGSMHKSFVIPEGEGLLDVGTADFRLSNISKASQLTLELSISGTSFHNSYQLWVYPKSQKLDKDGIIIAHELSDEVIQQLSQGKRVLLMPDSAAQGLNPQLTVGGLFQTDYWNYRMFRTISENNSKPVSPGTLGILCNPQHALFSLFPTEEHTNWQWWPVVKASRPMILDNLRTLQPSLSGYSPLVQVIDNVERNHKLGLVFEFSVSSGRRFAKAGRLLVVMADLEQAAQWPEGRQFYASVLKYMHSHSFAPTALLTTDQLRTLFSATTGEVQLQELNNISPY